MNYLPARACNIWAMPIEQVSKLQRGQWVYCCHPGQMETEKPARLYGVLKSGVVVVFHWSGRVGRYKQWDEYLRARKVNNRRGAHIRKIWGHGPATTQARTQ